MLDAMNALTVMDPRMDAGVVQVGSVGDADADAGDGLGKVPWIGEEEEEGMTLEEVCGCIDRLVENEVRSTSLLPPFTASLTNAPTHARTHPPNPDAIQHRLATRTHRIHIPSFPPSPDTPPAPAPFTLTRTLTCTRTRRTRPTTPIRNNPPPLPVRIQPLPRLLLV